MPLYELSAAKDSAHKRIVWSVHFCPTQPNIFASGSRDGLVKVWQLNETDDGSSTIVEEVLRQVSLSSFIENFNELLTLWLAGNTLGH